MMQVAAKLKGLRECEAINEEAFLWPNSAIYFAERVGFSRRDAVTK